MQLYDLDRPELKDRRTKSSLDVRLKPVDGDKKFDSQLEFESIEFNPSKRTEVKPSKSKR